MLKGKILRRRKRKINAGKGSQKSLVGEKEKERTERKRMRKTSGRRMTQCHVLDLLMS